MNRTKEPALGGYEGAAAQVKLLADKKRELPR
jgi:hypothetical protein